MRYKQSKDVYTAELMIIYDKKEIFRLLNEIFVSEGYLVRSSNSGKRALLSIAAKLPDIILLDTKMPSIYGFEICKLLKSDEKTKDIPIIFISALDETKDNIKAFNLGAMDFITKPFNRQEVIARVRTHLNFRIQQLQLEQENLGFQMEKEKRAAELLIANKEMAFQNEEKEKRAAELLIANKELLFQSEEKEKRAAELIIANKEMLFQNEEKEKRAAELLIANKELLFQNEEKENRAAELLLANKEMLFQNEEKEKRAAELLLANKEMLFQNEEKEKRAAELLIANKELLFQGEEKEKRAAELLLANKELAQKTKELFLAREQIEMASVIISSAWKYNKSLIEASIDPIITIDKDGIIIDVNTAVENATGLPKNKLIGTNFSEMFTDPEKAKGYYKTVFKKGQKFNYQLNLKHVNGFTTPVIYNAFVCSDNEENKVGVMVANNDITAKQKDDIVYLQINLNLLIKQRTSELMTANENLALENEKNEYLSFHDYLTGLHNRRYFENEITRVDTKTNLPISIIICDVDGLKLINDSFGHAAGDELLIKAAEVIKKACRDGDIISRLGGDEFAILLPKTDVEETALIANRIKEFTSQGKVGKIQLSISYGYDTKKTDKQSLMEVFATAENHMYRYKLYERSSIRSNTIDLIMKTLFEKSNRESQHSDRVGTICQAIASTMNFDKSYVKKMRIAGLVHDIGKIGIDDKILNKSGPLSNDEWLEIKKHPEIGWRILSTSNDYLELAQFVLNHHERWDGGGYPNGLKGEEILLESRIIAVADAYDAMTSKRTYRKGYGKEESIKELIRCSGTQFDPEIVDVFVNQVLPYDSNLLGGDKALISAVLKDTNSGDKPKIAK
jgi:diguanylate cyclase (GGDEF)-like protein/PAS domain S-box-containing protein